MSSPPRLSPYQNRLLLLAIGMGLVMCLLVARLWSLSIVHGDHHLALAEKALRSTSYHPATRGAIRLADGRPLAEDRAPGWVLEIRYPFIERGWLERTAREQAMDDVTSDVWATMTRAERDAAAEDAVAAAIEKRDRMLAALADAAGEDRRSFERRCEAIRRDVERLARYLEGFQRRDFARRAGLDPDGPVPGFRRQPLAEEVDFHEVVGGFDRATTERIRRTVADLGLDGEVRLTAGNRRVRSNTSAVVAVDRSRLPEAIRDPGEPLEIRVDGLLDHIVGGVREVQRHDRATRPFTPEDRGGYERFDTVGARGVERSQERRLRGERGRTLDSVDPDVPSSFEPPRAGDDVHLTIDLELQATIRALLHPDIGFTVAAPWQGSSALGRVPGAEGLPIQVGVAVIEVDTGRILALVDGPTRDEVGPERLEALESRVVANGWAPLGLAAAGGISPGSTVKPLVLAAALADPQTGLKADTLLHCRGYFFNSPNSGGKCHIYSRGYGHGDLDSEAAIALSCNCYFHEVTANILGAHRTVDAYRAFGFGEAPEIGLAWDDIQGARDANGEWIEIERRIGVTGGRLPDPSTWPRASFYAESAFLGTGQSSITTSILQVADAYATLCRGGIRLDPTLVDSEERRLPQRRRAFDDFGVPMTANAVAAARAGLFACVEEGTAALFDDFDVTMFGKTGTAQERLRVRTPAELVEAGEPEVSAPIRTHSWFAGFAAPEGPTQSGRTSPIAIAVCVRWGGSGGTVAAPIAREIMWTLQRLGYLTGETGGIGSVRFVDETDEVDSAGEPEIARGAGERAGARSVVRGGAA